MLLSAVVYWLVGVGGYATFKQRTAGDVLRNFGGPNAIGLRGAYERALKLCYGMAILGSIPLVILPFYSMLTPLLNADQMGGSAPHSSSGTSGSRRATPDSKDHFPPQSRIADPHLTTPHAGWTPTVSQHAFAVFIVLGLGMASALWLPNVEFIFGLTGATASVLIAYIMPALCFIRLHAATPELHASHFPGSANKQRLLVPKELKAQWACRRRWAMGLLAFGIISGILCTDAILSSISEEKAVVQLAQELVAREVVVAEATRAEQKAKEAAVAVSAVESAGKDLRAVKTHNNDTLGALAAAAASLNTIANSSTHHSIWDIQVWMGWRGPCCMPGRLVLV